MDAWIPLALFPEGALDSSVITTVWIGLSIIVFFNLRFGWVTSGLVVPGYLAPLILVKPYSALAILLEALVTYLLARFLSHGLARFNLWSYLFGRDRFFALVLISVLVRVVFDAWWLPELGQWLQINGFPDLDYRDQLHSFGLIIIALMANQWWKTGVFRGSLVMFITMALTLLVIRYVLMPWTNFSLSNLSYMYEDVASSILASPKSYIILLVSAYIASRMNLKYGWEFNGILIPSLLALQWHQPTKILISISEAVIILVIGSLLLATPWLKQANIEGARKLLLFFNISFIYKIALGYILLELAPESQISDAYGMGYLLSTLLAIKMHEKNITARMSRAILQTSITAILIAVPLGFALTFLPSPFQTLAPVAQDQEAMPIDKLPENWTLSDFIHQEKLRTYRALSEGGSPLPLPTELETFEAGIKALKAYQLSKQDELLQRGQGLLAQVGYQVQLRGEHYLVLNEQASLNRGWGAYVFNLKASETLLVEAIAPVQETIAAEGARWLFELLDASALATGGPRRQQGFAGQQDVLEDTGTFFYHFHRIVGRHNALQIRGYSKQALRLIAGERSSELEDATSVGNGLWISRTLPEGLNLQHLKSLIGDFQVHWQASPVANRLRDESRYGMAELFLTQQSLYKLIAEAIPDNDYQAITGVLRIDGYLQNTLLETRSAIASKNSQLYQAPNLDQLLFFEYQVLSPLMTAIEKYYRVDQQNDQKEGQENDPQNGQWLPEGEQTLKVIAHAARKMDYQLLEYRHQVSGEKHLILLESPQAATYRGSYIFRLGATSQHLIQIPRPIYESNSFEYGVNLYERLQARALMIAGAHPYANADQSADILLRGNKENFFNLVYQGILRHQSQALSVVQVRAFSPMAESGLTFSDVMLAKSNADYHALTKQDQQLIQVLEQSQLSWQFVDGQPETAGYEISDSYFAQYLAASPDKQLTTLWLSTRVRQDYRQQLDDSLQSRTLTAFNIPHREANLEQSVPSLRRSAAGLPADFRALLDQYVTTGNIHSLYQLRQQWPGWALEHITEVNQNRAYLLIFNPQHALAAVTALDQLDRSRTMFGDHSERQIAQFLQTRDAWLLFHKVVSQ